MQRGWEATKIGWEVGLKGTGSGKFKPPCPPTYNYLVAFGNSLYCSSEIPLRKENGCTNSVLEPVAIITVTIGVLHASFSIYMIFAPTSNVMSSVRTAEFTGATTLGENNNSLLFT